MRTVFRSLALFVAIAALVATAGSSTAPALQDTKKDTKKTDDKKADTKAEEVGKIEVYKAKDGWRFRVKNADGKSVAIGTVGHEKKEDTLKEIEFLKATFAKAKPEEVK